jgi:hypothetical protein
MAAGQTTILLDQSTGTAVAEPTNWKYPRYDKQWELSLLQQRK